MHLPRLAMVEVAMRQSFWRKNAVFTPRISDIYTVFSSTFMLNALDAEQIFQLGLGSLKCFENNSHSLRDLIHCVIPGYLSYGHDKMHLRLNMIAIKWTHGINPTISPVPNNLLADCPV